MITNPFKIYWKALISSPIYSLINFLRSIKILIITVIKIIVNPKITLENNFSEKGVLSPVEFTKQVLKISLWIVTILIFFEFYGKEESIISLTREYLINIIYIISVFLMISLSYFYNYFGNGVLNNSMNIANGFVSYFNVLFLILLFLSLFKVKFTNHFETILISLFFYSQYFFYVIGKSLKIKLWKTIAFNIIATIILILIVVLNYVALSESSPK